MDAPATRLAPAGRHPPKPSHQTKSFMKKPSCEKTLPWGKLELTLGCILVERSHLVRLWP